MIVSLVPVGNSRGIRLPKHVLDKVSSADKFEVEVSEKGILLKPVKDEPRKGWEEAFRKMHQDNEDLMEELPEPRDFQWEW
ncbi:MULTISPECIES: AbrB/MazE/SpoVT family DNA-binding domain-containing protein [unclassified Treponema]|uniref:AbrB/MazE/SpoVT family DNA-binding domain-containing protein n=1 Tax=unclassified Treponema TaxID=2638727 RepID=UPI0020A3C442|nr:MULTISPECIES: AbrB/MazE/SpoVT family DNA-binding domain-containing protein [unclassified Treponema]UTC66037.1 AbrB/MazE/SpoVT family DNA-binding domain-containing protein [Treponema sp. OMZ 789]UTC68767.1 AbrB/MazE/SpoVT family DNA-binding domain-containing protein [Treponema sp. OMZ 790]UTC71496.1 AbrB/MazE/SpoVT family DNA-binding domain-containing protein [Treponema sp. OMZ 791]